MVYIRFVSGRGLVKHQEDGRRGLHPFRIHRYDPPSKVFLALVLPIEFAPP